MESEQKPDENRVVSEAEPRPINDVIPPVAAATQPAPAAGAEPQQALPAAPVESAPAPQPAPETPLPAAHHPGAVFKRVIVILLALLVVIALLLMGYELGRKSVTNKSVGTAPVGSSRL